MLEQSPPKQSPTVPSSPTEPQTKPRLFTRRNFFKFLAGTTIMAAGTYGYMRILEPRWLRVERFDLPLKGLDPTLDGKQLAQISDIHLSQFMSPDQLADALQMVARLAPDWLMLTGDYVGADARDAAGLVDALRILDMPIFAIFGNHDLWTNRTTVRSYLEAGGATVLLNQAQPLGGRLWLAGTDDIWGGHPDLRAALAPIPTDATTILLAHAPDYLDNVRAARAPVALQLSGHTHGGQVRLPTLTPDAPGMYSYAPILPRYGKRYPIGLRAVDDYWVYTNRGLGLWPLPYRLNCRPEVTLITLRAA
jgi:predicted MPP superfamily phosphohydrolase